MSGGLKEEGEAVMLLCFGTKSGPPVPAADQSLADVQAALARQQKIWAEQLARDPTTFPLLERQIHLAFGQLADLCVAGLLAHAAAAPACTEASQKN
jgi:hypothetical protein